MRYTQIGPLDSTSNHQTLSSGRRSDLTTGLSERVFSFPPPSIDLAFDDGMIDLARVAWKTITSGDADADEDGFLAFADREGVGDDEE